MLVTPSGIMMFANDEQHIKALSPMLITPSGITMLAKDSQPLKA